MADDVDLPGRIPREQSGHLGERRIGFRLQGGAVGLELDPVEGDMAERREAVAHRLGVHDDLARLHRAPLDDLQQHAGLPGAVLAHEQRHVDVPLRTGQAGRQGPHVAVGGIEEIEPQIEQGAAHGPVDRVGEGGGERGERNSVRPSLET
ncbi:hypothetical protein [Methylobacterium sp. SyP6R]|uniref:hypothetical protein n=1 Tax=Methylobacterium sp. SyP6R TaxID=2718876 RepID=UPI001F27FB7C|nr:hypothetical protein [Methylobacterium sp. SyP6R]MCF4129881.1 hypothetical protein [Methylobacterium sp. SyP6R]